MANNLSTDSEIKIDDLFKKIEDLIINRDFSGAFNLIENNRSYITKYANVKQQLLLNKFYTKILYELALSTYEIEKNHDNFLDIFEKNRDFFEVHLEKPKYNRLLRYRANIKKLRRKKKLNIILPVTILSCLLLIYGVSTIDIFNKISIKNIYSSISDKFNANDDTTTIENEVDNKEKENEETNSNSNITSNIEEEIPTNEDLPSFADEDFLLPSSSKELSTHDITGMDAKDLRLAINEMYARHGYYFGPGANQRYFDEKTWYKPDMSIKSPNDIVVNFTEIENKNLSFLATQERQLKNN